MIETGWIFPDGTEYSDMLHYSAITEFIRGLRFQDLETKKKIDNEIEDIFFKHGGKDLYTDYAIRRLGWIKVGTSILHVINYAGYDWQSELVKPYEEAGYLINNFYVSSSYYLPIKCDITLAIRNGDERYYKNGKEYRYDGTDKDDYYIDKNGRLCSPPWNK